LNWILAIVSVLYLKLVIAMLILYLLSGFIKY